MSMKVVVSSKNPGPLEVISNLPSTVVKLVRADRLDKYVGDLTGTGHHCHVFDYTSSVREAKSIQVFALVS